MVQEPADPAEVVFLRSPRVKTHQSNPGAHCELKLGVCICRNPQGVSENK